MKHVLSIIALCTNLFLILSLWITSTLFSKLFLREENMFSMQLGRVWREEPCFFSGLWDRSLNIFLLVNICVKPWRAIFLYQTSFMKQSINHFMKYILTSSYVRLSKLDSLRMQDDYGVWATFHFKSQQRNWPDQVPSDPTDPFSAS